MARRSDDYAVGYGKPPNPTRFKKGRSGNPKGLRKRGRKSIGTILNEVLNRRIRVIEAGALRHATIREVMIMQLALKAAKGDNAALKVLLAFDADAERHGEHPPWEILYIPEEKGGSGR